MPDEIADGVMERNLIRCCWNLLCGRLSS